MQFTLYGKSCKQYLLFRVKITQALGPLTFRQHNTQAARKLAFIHPMLTPCLGAGKPANEVIPQSRY
jgi:hypothetical protein